MAKDARLSSYGRFAIMLAVIGVLFGLDSIFHLSFIYKLWPLIITILGTGFLGIFRTRNRKEPLFLTVGIYLIAFSGLAIWCNFTSWTVLGTLWPAFISFLGIAFIASFFFCQRKRLWLLIGLLLLSTSIVFFYVFSISSAHWWIVFILAGASVWLSERAK